MSSEETKIAVMQQEITYIKERVDDIATTLKENIAFHQERMSLMQEQMDKRFDGVYERYKELDDKKADKTEVDKINSVLSRLNWIIITAVLGALLALVVTNIK